MMIRIGVIDDHRLFARAFVILLDQLSSELQLKVESKEIRLDDITNGLKDLDLLFLDLELDNQDGTELLTKFKLDYPLLRIIILSMHSVEKVIRNVMKKGADGYLSKRTDQVELVTAIKKVMDGEVFLGADILQKITEPSNQKSKNKVTLNRFNVKMHLTKREAEILELISKGKSNKDIGEFLFISNETVSVHRKNLMKKFDVSSTLELLKVASEFDLI